MRLLSICVALVVAPLSLYALYAFDRVLRIEYEKSRDQWESDGMPPGFFWKAPESSYFGGNLSRGRLYLVWIFANPAWAANLDDCPKWLRRHRVCSSASYVLWLIDIWLFAHS